MIQHGYSHEVRDYTNCDLNQVGNLLPPNILHKHDLVILELVSLHLEANFAEGPPSYALCAKAVKLVHAATDYAARLSVEVGPRFQYTVRK